MIEPCSAPVPFDELVAYRRSELAGAAEERVEAHFFGCETCADRLAWLERLEPAVADAMRRGLFDVIVAHETVERLERLGSVIRKYELHAGDSVSCTSAPGDDMTVVTFHGPRRPGVPVTLVVDILDHTSGQRLRQPRPAVLDQQTGDVIISLAGHVQRSLGPTRVTLTLAYGDGPEPDTVGPFEMNHEPWPGS